MSKSAPTTVRCFLVTGDEDLCENAIHVLAIWVEFESRWFLVTTEFSEYDDSDDDDDDGDGDGGE